MINSLGWSVDKYLSIYDAPGVNPHVCKVREAVKRLWYSIGLNIMSPGCTSDITQSNIFNWNIEEEKEMQYILFQISEFLIHIFFLNNTYLL